MTTPSSGHTEQTKLIDADSLTKPLEDDTNNSAIETRDKSSAFDENAEVSAGCRPAFCRFPVSVYFIIANEFCERFNYFGVRTILTLYLLKFIGLGPDHSTAIFHLFVVLCYFSPIFGGIIADSLLGRFWTIVILSVVYCVGGVILAATAVPRLGLAGALIGLTLIGLGTGGIKPNVAAFGADQIPESKAYLREAFFSTFYFSINLGSMLSTVIIPIVRTNTYCMGYNCYALAFGIPAIAMALAIIVFVAGKPLYHITKPGRSVVSQAACCIVNAAKNYRAAQVKDVDKQFLDYADSDSYPPEFIRDLRQFSNLLLLYIPFPIFWALFDQMGSRWTIQASLMDGYMFSDWSVLPDQMQALNSLLILVLIPIFDCCIYPLMSKLHMSTSLCKRMGVGMLLASTSFVAAMAVQMRIDAELPVVPRADQLKLKFVNAINSATDCPVHFGYRSTAAVVKVREFSDPTLHPSVPQLLNVTAYTSLEAECLVRFDTKANMMLAKESHSYNIVAYGSGQLGIVPAATQKHRNGMCLVRVMITDSDLARKLVGDQLLMKRISRESDPGITFQLKEFASFNATPTEIQYTAYQPVHSGFYSLQLFGNFTGEGKPVFSRVAISSE